MENARHIKLFRNGRNQALRIPRDMELPGEEALIYREGAKLVIEPAPSSSLLTLLSTLSPIDEEFPEIDDTAPDSVEL